MATTALMAFIAAQKYYYHCRWTTATKDRRQDLALNIYGGSSAPFVHLSRFPLN
jgi:hypothetical protein